MASTNITTFPGKVGISNANPTHTLAIGSNVYVDDIGINKLVVLGSISTTGTLSGDGSGISNIQSSNVNDFASNVTRITNLEASNADVWSNLTSNVTRITTLESGDMTISGEKSFSGDVTFQSNIHVKGDLLVANTINMVVSDPIIELGSNNLNTGDVGLVMTRHGTSNSNVAVFFDETADVLKLGYTLNGANDTTIELDSNALAVNIQGALTAASVNGDGSGITNIQSANVNDFASNVSRIASLESEDMTISGEKTFSSNLEVGTANLFVDTTTGFVGVGTVSPEYALHINLDSETGSSNTVALIIQNQSSDYTQIENGFGSRIRFETNRGYDSATQTLPSAEIKGYIYDGAGDTGDYHALDLDVYGDNISLNRGISILSKSFLGGPADTIMHGNVGIGTTDPTARLELYSSTLDTNHITVYADDSIITQDRIFVLSDVNGSGLIQMGDRFNNDSTTYKIQLNTEGDSYFTGGNVGIGTTTPQGLLHLSSGTSGDAHLIIEADTDNDNEVDNPKIVFRQDGGFYTGELGLDSNRMVFRSKSSTVDNTGFVFYSNVFPTFHADQNNLDDLESTEIEVMRIEGNGNVGIGTTSPVSILHVRGTGQTSTTSFDTSQTLGASIFAESSDSTVGSGGSLLFGTYQGKFAAIKAGILDGASNTMGNLHFMTRNATADATLTNRMTITNTGNVGIGVTEPISVFNTFGGQLWDGDDHTSKVCATLQVGRGGGNGASRVDYGTGAILEFRHASDYRYVTIESVSDGGQASAQMGLLFKTTPGGGGPVERMRIKNDGNVGIGTTNPTYKLDVHGTSNVGALTATTGAFSDALTATSGTFTGAVTTPYINGIGYVAERTYTFNPTNNTSKYFLGWTSENALDIEIYHVGFNHGASARFRVEYKWSSSTPPVITSSDLDWQGIFNFYYTHKNDRFYVWFNETLTSSNNDIIYQVRMKTVGKPINLTEPTSTEVYGGAVIGVSAASEFTNRGLVTKPVDAGDCYVGIGTTSPAYKLDVHGTSNVGALTATTGTFSDDLAVGTSDLFVDVSTGNVGIGTASPEGVLDIVTSSTTPALWLRNSTQGGWTKIRMSDDPDESYAQYCTLEYNHQDAKSLGFQNRLHFATTETTTGGVFSTEGSLMIGVDGKDGGYMTNSTASGRKNLWIQSTYGGNTSQNYGWWIGAQNQALSSTDNDLYFAVVRDGTLTVCGTILDQRNAEMNFTGQHRTFVKDVPIQQLEDKEGLIVSADQNEFIRMSGGIARGNEAITTNESLPVVSFSTKSNDKKCFGVVSTTEDPENRVEVYGNFASNIQKELGDTRVYINSVGEGAIWVTDINGPLESGDYITTSNVTGYGQRQDDDILHNYTVAKITMDCDFNPRTQPKKIIKKELAHVDYWIDYATSEIKQGEYETLPENEREIHEDKYYKIYKREIQKANPENDRYVHEVREELVNVLDEHGQLQWEDHPTETEKAYKIRYLDALGAQTDEANVVHRAAFVGCTYHCG